MDGLVVTEAALLASLNELVDLLRPIAQQARSTQARPDLMAQPIPPGGPVTPWTGRGVIGEPGAVIPPQATRTAHYWERVMAMEDWSVTGANTGMLNDGFPIPADGLIQVVVVVKTATYPTVTWNNTDYYALNGGTNQAAEALGIYAIPVARGDVFNVSLGAAATVSVIRAFYEVP